MSLRMPLVRSVHRRKLDRVPDEKDRLPWALEQASWKFDIEIQYY